MKVVVVGALIGILAATTSCGDKAADEGGGKKGSRPGNVPEVPAAPGEPGVVVPPFQAIIQCPDNSCTVGSIATCGGVPEEVADLNRRVIWHAALSEGGDFMMVKRGNLSDGSLAVDKELAHKFLSCHLVVDAGTDTQGAVGESDSKPIQIADSKPLFASLSFQGDEETPLTISLGLENGYIDVDGDLPSGIAVQALQGGVLGDAWDCTQEQTCVNTFTPDKDFAGAAGFEFRMLNAFGEQAEWATATINIANVNDAPLLADIPNASVFRHEPLQVALSATDADATDVLTFACSAGCPTGLTVQGNQVSWTPAQDQLGSFDVTFHVSDGNGGTASKVAHIVVPNRAPAAFVASHNGSDSTVVGSEIACLGSASDADSDTLNYNRTWSGSSSEAGPFAPVASAVSVDGVMTIAAADAHKFIKCAISVDDGNGGTASSESGLIQIADSLPVAQNLSFSGTEDQVAAIAITQGSSFSDADNDAVTGITIRNLSIGQFSGAWNCSVGNRCENEFVPPTDFFGPVTFEYKVANAYGEQAQWATATINVANVNDAPVLADIPDASVFRHEPLQFTLSATDADPQDSLSFACTLACPTGLTVQGNQVSWTPAQDQLGSFDITFQVSDGNGGTASKVAHIVVPNRAPAPFTASHNGSASTVVGSDIACLGATSDADSDTLTYTRTWSGSSTENGTFAPVASSVSGDGVMTIAAADAHKFIKCAISVDDGNGGTASSESGVIQIADSLPVAQNISFNATEDQVAAIAITQGSSFSDADNDAVTGITIRNLSIGQFSGAWNCGSGNRCENAFAPPSDFFGAVTFEYKVANTYGEQAQWALATINVANVNDVPVLADIPDTSGYRHETLQFALSATDADPQDSLSFACTLACPTGLTVQGNQVSWTPAQNQLGSFDVTFQVSDGNGGTASKVAHIVVPNRAPAAFVASHNGSASTVVGGDIACLGSTSDADNDTLTYTRTWSGSSTENGTFAPVASSVSPGGVMTIAAADAHKFIRCTISVDDGNGGTASSESGVIQIADSLPVAQNLSFNGTEDQVAAIAITQGSSFSDADNDPVTGITVRNLSAGQFSGAWNCSSGNRCENVFAPSADFFGVVSFEYKVANTYGEQAQWATATINVANVNDAPVLADIPDASVFRGTPLQFTLSATDADPQDVLSYACAASCPAGLTVQGSQVSWTPSQNQLGSFDVTFRVSDNHGAFSTGVAHIVVPNRPPLDFVALHNGTVSTVVGNQVICSGSTSDPDLDALTVAFQWFASTTPDGTFSAPASQVQGDTINIGIGDAHKFLKCSITVDDGHGGVVSATSSTFQVADSRPIASAIDLSGQEDSSIGLLVANGAGYADADGDELTSVDVGTLSNGTIDPSTWECTIETGCSTIFIPNPNFAGATSFAYQVDNDWGTSLWSTISINFAEVNDAPVFAPIADQDARTSSQLQFLLSASDVDPADVLTFSCVTGCPEGLTISDNIVTWTPSPTQIGQYSLLLRVSDGRGGNDAKSALITVTDGTPPSVPVLSGTNPTSPSNVRSFVILGTADSESTVRFFSNSTCSGSPFQQVNGALFNTSGLAINLSVGSTINIYSANSIDIAGNLSACSTAVQFLRFPESLAQFTGAEASSNPANFTPFNGQMFFVADNGTTGVELWRTDGTSDGTALVKDINAAGNSNPANLTVVGSKLFFSATNEQNGTELWVTDGTTAGTTLVADLNAGPTSSSPASFIDFNGVLIFSATSATAGAELFRSDGTSAGTYIIKDIRPGSGASVTAPVPMVKMGGLLYFAATNGTTGVELWSTDGTSAGTVLVKDLNAGTASSSPTGFVLAGTEFFFRAADATYGAELWRSNGTAAGTVLAADIAPGTAASTPTGLVYWQNKILMQATTTDMGAELWAFDTTTSTAALVMDIYAGTTGSAVANLTATSSTVLFSATTSANGNELWKTDGTTAGTSLVKDIRSGTTGSSPVNFVLMNNLVYFRADSGSNSELWKSNGEASGTVQVKDIYPSGSSTPTGMTVLGNKLYFKATDPTSATELWSSDGTGSGTALVKNINGKATANATAGIAYNGNLIFAGYSAAAGLELWKSDGTIAGTALIKDIYAGATSSAPSGFAVSGGYVYFSARTSANGYELWRTDGTANGTTLVKDIISGTSSSSPAALTDVNGLLFFRATGSGIGAELYVSDGTSAGTVLVKDIYSGGTGSTPSNLINAGGVLLFTATDATNSTELWKSDGTSAGTVLVKDIRGGSAASTPAYLTYVAPYTYFTANDGTTGVELWKTDGTTSGTVLVKDIYPGATSSTPTGLINFNGTLFFAASDNLKGKELWKSDGTSAGTVMVADIYSGTGSSNPNYLIVSGGKLFFAAATAAEGLELWKSDGTTAGTALVTAILSGAPPANPQYLTDAGGTLFFYASNGLNGFDMWRSDGTALGTYRVFDSIRQAYALPYFVYTGDNLFFVDYAQEYMQTLWHF